MKHIQKFEGFSLFKKKKPQDEVTAIGILKQIPDDIYIEYNSEMDSIPVVTTYTIDLNDFIIKCEQEWSPFGTSFSIYADGVRLTCSEKVSKQIYDKLSEIHGRPAAEEAKKKKDDDDFIKRDAKARFRTNSRS